MITMDSAKRCVEVFADIGKENVSSKLSSELFGECFKAGIHEDSVDQDKIAELLRFNTSKCGNKQISLKYYDKRLAVSTFATTGELAQEGV